MGSLHQPSGNRGREERGSAVVKTEQSPTANLKALQDGLTHAKAETGSYGAKSTPQQSPAQEEAVTTTLIYREQFGSTGAFVKHARLMKSLYLAFEQEYRDLLRSKGHPCYQGLNASFDELSKASRQSPEDYVSALGKVLGCSIALRQLGFTDPALSKIMIESLQSLVVLKAGHEAHITVAQRGLFDRLLRISRERSESALAGVFRGDSVLRAMAWDVAKWLDVAVLTKEDTCRRKLAKLGEDAAEHMAKVYSARGRTGADAYERTLEKNEWVQEGIKSFGIPFGVLQEKLRAVQWSVCSEKLEEVRSKTTLVDSGAYMAAVQAGNGGTFQRTLQENSWVKDANQFGGELAERVKNIEAGLEERLGRIRRSELYNLDRAEWGHVKRLYLRVQRRDIGDR